MSSVAFLFLICLACSLHACNARLLAFSDNQIGHKSYHFAKEVEKAKLSDETSNPKSNMKADLSIPSVECLRQDHQAKSNGRTRNENRCANALRLEILRLHLEKHDAQPSVDDGTTSGNGITKSFSQMELQQSIIEASKGQEGHGRSMLGYVPQDTAKEGDAVEDIVVMDYAQPHRKPPIHNEKP